LAFLIVISGNSEHVQHLLIVQLTSGTGIMPQPLIPSLSLPLDAESVTIGCILHKARYTLLYFRKLQAFTDDYDAGAPLKPVAWLDAS
jgi:hypothetical protein